eukprot:gene50792-67998_t
MPASVTANGVTVPTAPVPAASMLREVPAGLPSDLLTRRADIRQAEQQLIATNANIGAARAAFFPRIALTASAGTASSTLSGLFAGGSQAWSFAPSISVPIFDGGANRANLRVAEAQQKIQIATYEKAVQTAFREVADALAERRTLAERLDAQRSLLGATSRSFELSQSLFRSGASSYLDVLDAQRAYYAAQQALIGLQLTEQTNRLTIYKTELGESGNRRGPQQPSHFLRLLAVLGQLRHQGLKLLHHLRQGLRLFRYVDTPEDAWQAIGDFYQLSKAEHVTES